MAQSASATLKANALSASRVVSVLFQIAWGRSGDQWPTDWATQSTDETTRLKSVSWDRSIDLDALSAGRGGGIVAQMRVVLDNSAQRFSPFNSAGALYSSLSATTTTTGGESVRYPTMWQTPVRLSMGFYDSIAGHERVVVFAGLIDAVVENYGLNGDQTEITCLDRGALLLQRKASTRMYLNQRTDDWIRLTVSGSITTGSKIERGVYTIPHCWLDDENLWAEAQMAAGAEGGVFYFDEVGDAVFRNSAWWHTAADSVTSVQTFTVARLQNLVPNYDYNQVRTGAIVQYQPRLASGDQVVWRRDGIVVPPSGAMPTTIDIDAKFYNPVTALFEPVKGKDYFPISASGVDLSGHVNVSIPQASLFAQRAVLRFTNSSQQTAFIATFSLRGNVLTGGPQEEIERNAASPLVPRNQALVSGNSYIQTVAQAELLATITAYRKSFPRLAYTLNGVPALPWLQLGDCVTIDVSEPVTADRTAIVTKLGFSWSPQGPFLMTLEAVDKAGLFEYSDYHVLGTTHYGSGKAFV
jgi:hypothetical protein